MAGGSSENMDLLTRCLEFCQLLGIRYDIFHLSVSIGEFSLTMNHGYTNSSWRKQKKRKNMWASPPGGGMIADWRPFWLGGLGTPNPPVLPNPPTFWCANGGGWVPGGEETPPPPEETQITKRNKKKSKNKVAQVDRNMTNVRLSDEGDLHPLPAVTNAPLCPQRFGIMLAQHLIIMLPLRLRTISSKNPMGLL